MSASHFGPEGRDEPKAWSWGQDLDGSADATADSPGVHSRPRPSERPSGPSTRRAPAAPRSGWRNLLEWVVVIVGALVVALLIKTYLFQAFYIPSESMEPTLTEGDRVLVSKFDYGLDDVDRGDVVVFQRPPNEPPNEIEDLIKRVVGLPGETVEGRDGTVFVDGTPLEESYLPGGALTDPFPATVVPDGSLFVMGDNRGNSRDSRVFGPIDGDLLVGRAVVTVWPLGRLGGL